MPQYLIHFMHKTETLHTTYRALHELPALTEATLLGTEKALTERVGRGGYVEILAVTRMDDTPVPRPWSSTLQLNGCSVVMPPVESPLLIEVAPGVIAHATRSAHAENRDDALHFNLECGTFIGRPRWTHA